MRIPSMLLPVAAALALVGCAATSVTPQGAAVELVTARPSGCKVLGEVVGKQGNVFSGDFTSNENLMVGARNDLRNKVAGMGGNVAHMQNTLNATHPYSSGAISTTMVATAFACPRS